LSFYAGLTLLLMYCKVVMEVEVIPLVQKIRPLVSRLPSHVCRVAASHK